MTKIDIISGFLGAGKTTLIQKLLTEALSGERVALVENEYGEVGIDGGFLKSSDVQIKELNSGCICCTLAGDFTESLIELLKNYDLDRILIEPSGVGKLSDVISAVRDAECRCRDDVSLNGLAAVVNGIKAVRQIKSFGEFFNNQIEYAASIIISRTQKMSEESLIECTDAIRRLNQSAAVITTPWDQIGSARLLEIIESGGSLIDKMLSELSVEAHEHYHHDNGHSDHEHHDHKHHDHKHHDHEHHEHACGHDHHADCGHDHAGHHHADEVFDSFGIETPRKFTRDELQSILTDFSESEEYGTVLRAKGMVPAQDGSWIYFDMVPGETQMRFGDPDYTGRLCVIGVGLDTERLTRLFSLNSTSERNG